jgi:acyl-CoA thioesterase I
MTVLIEDGAVVLFQGDSITDAGRGRQNEELLGGGYAGMAASRFSAAFPTKNVRFLNRGVGGDRAVDLQARWDDDCLALKPDWVSIMIGINDTWRSFDSSDPTGTTEYEAACRNILTRTRDELGAKLILLEPFLLPVPEDRLLWRDDLDPKIQALRSLSREFGAIYVPLDGLFAAAATRHEPAFWAPDGVHPTAAGHALIAEAWLSAVGAV